MKYTIEDAEFTYQVDWTKKNTVEGGFEKEYHPTVKESLEAFLLLLGRQRFGWLSFQTI